MNEEKVRTELKTDEICITHIHMLYLSKQKR